MLRLAPATLALLAAALLIAAACGGDGDDTSPPDGRLTDPSNAPTATPWPQPPEPIILDPDALTPISELGGDGDDGETGDGDGQNGTDGDGDGATPSTCGDTYTVQAGDVPFSIAEKCGVPADEISDWVSDMLDLNGIDDPTTLRVGQELQIPR